MFVGVAPPHRKHSHTPQRPCDSPVTYVCELLLLLLLLVVVVEEEEVVVGFTDTGFLPKMSSRFSF